MRQIIIVSLSLFSLLRPKLTLTVVQEVAWHLGQALDFRGVYVTVEN